MSDDIRTHVATDEYRSNWERIFGKKEETAEVEHNHFGEVFLPDTCPACAVKKQA
jgi:hypothetical protein